MIHAPNIKTDISKAIDRELQLRDLARHNLSDFMWYRLHAEGRVDSIRWGWYIDCMCEYLQALYDREIRRLIMNVPPRHLKSETIQGFSAWVMGRDNSHRSSQITASYTAGLAQTNSMKTRSIMLSGWYGSVFGSELHQAPIPGEEQTEHRDGGWGFNVTDRGNTWHCVDTGAPIIKTSNIKQWITDGNATYVAAGVGGELTGKGGYYIIGDDLLKPSDANSEVMREKTNQWLGETLESRLNSPEEGVIVHICQRLHELDPAGYLLEQAKIEGAEQYEHVCIPLIAERKTIYMVRDFYHVREPGEMIDERHISRTRAKAMQISMGKNFDGQYQQRPSKMEGGMLKPRYINLVKRDPMQIKADNGIRPQMTIDLASKEKETQKDDPDYSTYMIWGKDKNARRWILEVWRDRLSMDKVAGVLFNAYMKWGCVGAWCEKGALLNVLQPYLDIISRERSQRMLVAGVPLPQTGDGKIGRAHGAQAYLHGGLVWAPADQPWWHDFRAELASFPNGAHDDQVDAFSLACMIDEASVTGTPTPKAPARSPSGAQVITGDMLDAARQQAINRMRHGDNPY